MSPAPAKAFAEAASRELAEETGLVVAPELFAGLGTHRYLPGKRLALFVWRPHPMPEPAGLVCRSTFALGSQVLPEFDRFSLFGWDAALDRVGKNLARVLASVRDGLAR